MVDEAAILLKVAGGREAQAELDATSLSVAGLRHEVDYASASMVVAAKRGFLMNQMMYTLRRFAYFGTIALGTMAAGAIALGFNFDSAMQQATVSLQPVQNDIGNVHDLLMRLFNLTKYTPFQFKDVTIAFRQMYLGMRTVGVTSDMVMETLQSMIDALAAVGKTSPMNLNRVAIALQHMAFQGRLTGYTVNQLARDGIPIFAALHKELGLTGDQLHHISELGIPTKLVLQAINRYIETTPGLAHAAHRQATMTLHGLFTTFKDNISQTVGLAEKSWFHSFQGMLNGANDWFNRLNANLDQSHNLIKSLDATVTPASHNIARGWALVASILHDAWVITGAIVETFAHSRPLLLTLIGALALLAGILKVIADTTGVWVPRLKVLIPLMITYWIWTKSLAAATKLYWEYQKLLVIWTVGWRHKSISAYRDVRYFWSLFANGYIKGADKVIIHTALMDRAVLGLRSAFAGASLAGFGWLGLALLIGYMLVNLYLRWKPFRDIVNETARWIWKHYAVLLLLGAGFGMTAFAVAFVTHHFQLFRGIVQSVVRWVRELVHWLMKAVHLMGHIPGMGWAGHQASRIQHVLSYVGLQQGGMVTGGGAFMVGERGPELAMLPAGSAVSPMSVTNSPISNFFGGNSDGRPLVVEVYLDSKLVHKSFARRQNDKAARL